MMKRNISRVLLAMAVTGLLGGAQAISGAGATEDMCVPMGKIALKSPEGVQAKRSPVEFPHARHFDISCVTCHHTWGRTEPVVGCMTSGCHDLTEAPKKKAGEPAGEEASINYFKPAYHKLCITCHRDIKAKNLELQKSLKAPSQKLPQTGPTTCTGCHSK
ncbi:MAG: cytochrome c3 family protein [Hyphomicrobiales bacterium]